VLVIWRSLSIFSVTVLLLFEVIGLSLVRAIFRKPPHWFHERVGASLRSAFQKLSGAFVKFGQVLSIRADILPRGITTELEQLLDHVIPERFEVSSETICTELGISNLAKAFAEFEPIPLAAASFATVYGAKLTTNEEVAVKVQRREIRLLVRYDIRILKFIAWLIDLSGISRRVSVSKLVREFAEWTKTELNYLREGQHMEYFRSLLGEKDLVHIPRVFWQYSTPRLLVGERIRGVWLTELFKSTDGKGTNINSERRLEVSRMIFRNMLMQAFEAGFFHADPHPGNICIMPDGRVGIVDLGMVGSLSEFYRKVQLRLLVSVQRGDIDGAFAAVSETLNVPPDSNLAEFRRRFEQNVREWNLSTYQPTAPASQHGASQLLLANFAAARECGLSIAVGTAAYYRTLMVVDFVTTRLSMDFDTRKELESYLINSYQKRMLQRASEGLESQGLSLAMAVSQFLDKISAISVMTQGSARPAEDPTKPKFNPTRAKLSRLVLWLSRIVLLLSALGISMWIAKQFSAHSELLIPLNEYVKMAYSKIYGWSRLALPLSVALGLFLRWLSLRFWIDAYRIT
jgi:ubiquinone biosynthesis protein